MEQFLHIRVLLGIVLGLAITTLLKGLARFVQHPGRERVYGVHIAWALSMFTLLAHFWWWEFRLVHVAQWSFVAFAFLILYVVVLFVLCTLLFPDDIGDYQGWRDYFLSRRQWFFGIMAASYVIDFGDTLIKGRRSRGLRPGIPAAQPGLRGPVPGRDAHPLGGLPPRLRGRQPGLPVVVDLPPVRRRQLSARRAGNEVTLRPKPLTRSQHLWHYRRPMSALPLPA